jgi:Na+-transporting methylmalonyl-CoA/oxaloacetate decarboxylase gamma subunit
MGTPAQPPKAKPVRTRKRSRVASLTKIAWPIALCFVVLTSLLIFRQEIGGLIPRMKGIKIDVSSKTAEAEFTEDVQTQIAQLDGLQRDVKAVVDAASDSQDKAIATAWLLIEKRQWRLR